MSANPGNFQGFFQHEFMKNHRHIKALSSGAEGIVSKWSYKATGRFVAVKEPKAARFNRWPLRKEAEMYRKILAHDHLVKFLGLIFDFNLAGPAIILEYSPFGNILGYRKKLLRTEGRVPEMTLWKLLRDMSLGLDWLHNHCDVPYVHGDFKPDNILAFPPESWNGSGVPLLPTFKICDINRTAPVGEYKIYNGTSEFGPQSFERHMPQRTAVDMWSLGATIQKFALLLTPRDTPLMHREDFMTYAEKNLSPSLVGHLRAGRKQWRFHQPPVYRPLDESIEYQKTVLCLEQPVPPYSQHFNGWYKKLYEENPLLRVRSAALVRDFVPIADEQIKMFKKRRMVQSLKRYARVQAMTRALQP